MEENENKKISGFLPGILCGLLLAALVAVAGLGALNMNGSRIVIQKKGTEHNGRGGIYELLSDESKLKLDRLSYYVKNKFLLDYDEKIFMDTIASGVMYGLDDPYSAYYDQETLDRFLLETNGNFCGIGVLVQQNIESGLIEVIQVFDDSPALEAGIEPGDLIAGADEILFYGMELDEALTYVKGEEGTDVELLILRGEEEFTVTCTRRYVVGAVTVFSRMLEGNIGFIRITEFDAVTRQQFAEAMIDLDEQGMEGLIVDVRNNPGGLLDVVVDILRGLLPEGKIVYTEEKNGQGEAYYSDGICPFTKPMAVLINGRSASAAEIFSAALHDHGVATLVGKNTFGKGVVQKLFDLGDGTAIKLTISRYYTPNGICIHGEGVAPDIDVDQKPLPEGVEVMTEETDTQFQEAYRFVLEELKKKE